MKGKMKNLFKQAVSIVCATAMVVTGMVSDLGSVKVEAAAEHTVWVVGDSTVCGYNEPTKYYPRCGYGEKIQDYLDDTYAVRNLAVSGTSSKSFTSHANYATLTAGIKEGDVLVIGFGHNDEKADDTARFTSADGDYQTEGSFAKSLYDNYVKMAADKGAEVVLCTPIVRRTTGTYSGSNIHVTDSGDYPQAIKDLGAAVGVPVIDLTGITKALYEEIGVAETLKLHSWGSSKPDSVDNTHINAYGAKKVAYRFAQKLQETSLAVAGHVSLAAGDGVEATDLQVGANYVETTYDNNLAQSTVWSDYTVNDVSFKGTVFGYASAKVDNSKTNFILETDADKNMHVAAKNNKTKIAGDYDGLVMYYYRIPADKQFSLSAKATLNSAPADNQSAFGLMARDDMYIDTVDTSGVKSDYVVAGTLGSGKMYNCFYRKGGKLGNTVQTLTADDIATGSVIELSIVSNTDGYTCTFGDKTPQSAGFDFPLTTVDSEFVYVGMFASRNVDVTYSSIKLVVDGKTIMDTSATDVKKYSVAIEDSENGVAISDIAIAKAGDSVQLDTTSARGYMFDSWEVTPSTVVIAANNTFTMPASNVSIKANFKVDPDYVAVGGPVQVWDFAGVEEPNTTLYTNNIIACDYVVPGIVAKGGDFSKGGEDTFGSLTMKSVAGDRLYTNVAALSAYAKGTKDYIVKYAGSSFIKADGTTEEYTSGGAWYCNGARTSASGYVVLKDVKAGDRIDAYMGIFQDVEPTKNGIFAIKDITNADGQEETLNATTKAYQKYTLVAAKDGDYKIYEVSGGKPLYHRIVKYPATEVKGSIALNGLTLPASAKLTFINDSNKQKTDAVLDGTNFTVKLAPGYGYTATITGVTGFGFTNASKHVSVAETDILEGKSGISLSLETKSTYTYSGALTGIEKDYDISDLEIVMVPPVGSDLEEVDVTVNKTDRTFSVTLEPDVAYTIVTTGAWDYEVSGETVIEKSENYTADMNFALTATYEVSGKFFGLDENAVVSALRFVNVDDQYEYVATVNDGYSISLRNGSYLAKATVDGYSTKTHVVVNGKNVSKDLMFVSTKTPGSLAKVSDIYVGYPKKANNYETVSAAVQAAAQMNPTSEAERITVHIAPGTYREQIVLSTPYVSFVNDSSEEVLLTWYYGIGYQYYSSNGGFYSAEKAYDKFDKAIASKWGTSVYVKNTATAFRASGITFENSFNRYITDEELEDGVEVGPPSKDYDIQVVRNYNTNVTSKAATERAAAMVIEADKAEFVNCNFLGSQDTLYTAGSYAYFRNCTIEGQTDYIFGSGNVVFDACELSWKGYDVEAAGYITANRPAAGEKGYLFRNCVVTGNPKLTVAAGYFGRPWGADSAVTFLNTKLESSSMIVAAGWYQMSGNQPENAKYHEFNTTTVDGTAVNTSGRVTGVMSAEDAAKVKVNDFFGSWIPAFYVEEAASIAFTTNPYLTDNGDINTPYPGHTLAVGYSLGNANDANDVSIIKWYRVKGNEETLIKTASAVTDRTYQIATEDIGSVIKAVVIPTTVSGNVGEAKECSLENAVYDGYEVPGGAGDVELGDGINVFLIGDSTVRDYSAQGVYSNGNARDEGAWGEFLQGFFDKEKVTIVNYANGGRSTRNYINEGALDTVKAMFKEGDYVFVQFGHNDCSDDADYIEDRYVPLGTPDANGIYPVTAGEKKPSTAGLTKYGTTCYTYDCGGTYKWFLKQYTDAAKEAGAIPVLVTPVSRMYFNSDGTIKAHHDASSASDKSNTYVTAMKQLAQEENIICIDAFEATKDMFEAAYTASKNDTYAQQIMYRKFDSKTGSIVTDKTHNNKLGGLIEATIMASEIQKIMIADAPINLAYAIKMPSKVMGVTVAGETAFTVTGAGKLTAYNSLTDYTEEATYWTTVGQNMIDAISAKAAELNPINPGTGDDGPGTGENPGSNDGDDPVPPEEGEFAIFGLRKEYSFTGAKIIPDIYVMYGEKILAPGVDYTVSYKNNTKPGTAELLISGKGNYAGKGISKTFKIEDVVEAGLKVIDLTGAKIAKIPAVEFAPGKAWFPDLSITFKKGETPKVYTYDGKKYVTEKGEVLPAYVAVSNNVNKGTATILLTGDKNAKGKVTTLKATFKINAVDLAKAKTKGKVEVKAENAVYSPKGAASEEICVKYNGKTLVNGTDYTVKYSANKKVGTAVATITGKGNYAKKLMANYQIERLDMTEVQVVAVKATAGMKAGKVTAIVVDGNGDALKASQYTLHIYSDGKELDAKATLTAEQEISVVATAKDLTNLEGSTPEADFEVGADFSKVKASIVKVGKATKTFTYTGTPVELTKDDLVVTIKENKVDKTLELGEGYEIAGYTANINKGTATVILKGINGYSGYKTVKFKITGRTIELK